VACEVASVFETKACVCQSVHCNIPDDFYLPSHRCKNLNLALFWGIGTV
jgi:hypothetical protein